MKKQFRFTKRYVDILPVEVVLGMRSVDAEFYGGYSDESVRAVLDDKRKDDHYEYVVRSLALDGFVKPIRVHDGSVTDGHHRIAAAIDLGWKFVPVETRRDCDEDSGDWCGPNYNHYASEEEAA